MFNLTTRLNDPLDNCEEVTLTDIHGHGDRAGTSANKPASVHS
jgi:hypothetical protein